MDESFSEITRFLRTDTAFTQVESKVQNRPKAIQGVFVEKIALNAFRGMPLERFFGLGMNKSFQNIQVNGDTDAYLGYAGIERAALANQLHSYFLSNGYKLIDGHPGNGMYERGNKTMRILFGAFVKYFKFGVSLANMPDGSHRVWFKRETSGFSGGLVGIQQVKNEFTRVCQGLQQF